MYKYLFIDNDDTLMDFLASEYDCIGKTLRHFGLDDADGARLAYSGFNRACWEAFDKGEIDRSQIKPTRFANLFKFLGAEYDDKLIKEFGIFYETALAESAIWVEGAVDFLKKAKPFLKIYVVTNGSANVQNNRFKKAKMLSLVDGVVISEEIGAKKPDTAFFDYALKLSGCKDKREAIIVGDSPSSDIEGGRLSGIDTCLFDFRNKHKTSPANYMAHSFSELYNILFHVKQEG